MRIFATTRVFLAAVILTCLPSLAQDVDRNSTIGTVRVAVTFDAGSGAAWSGSASTVDRLADVRAGSGFVLSDSGYILTSASLVLPADPDASVESVEVLVVEGVVEPDPGAVADENGFEEPQPTYVTTRFNATLIEVDFDLGVALLEIDPPAAMDALKLGDSDAVSDGQRASALGRGGDGRPVESAVRLRLAERPRHGEDSPPLSLAGRIDPLAEGGPLVDAEGYVIGLITRRREGLVAVPVNAAKQFIAGLPASAALPWELVLAPTLRLEEEGLRLQMIEGLWDTWPGRTRFVSERDARGVSLRIDRIASPRGLGALEAELLSGGFGSSPAVRVDDGSRDQREIRRSSTRLSGSARAEIDGERYAIEYLIARVGGERIVARYEAPEDLAAYNRSVLRNSLDEMRVVRLLMQELSRPVEISLERERFETGDATEIVVPAGWHVQRVVAEPPDGLSAPDETISASPPKDYTASFSAYYWADGARVDRIVAEGVDQVREMAIHGLEHWSLIRSLPVGRSGTVLLECRAPVAKRGFVEDACRSWMAGATEQLVLLGASDSPPPS